MNPIGIRFDFKKASTLTETENTNRLEDCNANLLVVRYDRNSINMTFSCYKFNFNTSSNKSGSTDNNSHIFHERNSSSEQLLNDLAGRVVPTFS